MCDHSCMSHTILYFMQGRVASPRLRFVSESRAYSSSCATSMRMAQATGELTGCYVIGPGGVCAFYQLLAWARVYLKAPEES